MANPTVSIIAPLDGATLNDLTKVRVHAASEIGLSSILIYSESILVGTLSCTGNSCLETMNTVSWITNGLATGPHFLYAVATDIFGNSSSSTPITVNK